jgi:DNA polymerase III delta prime subunit
MGNLENVNTDELGAAIDMIKDLEEAIYYHTITKAMEGDKYSSSRHMEKDQGKMYYREMPMRDKEYPIDFRDYRDGKSPMSRRMYMESKELHKDKEVRVKELDKYMHELTDDIMEMIEDSSLEEKQML